MKRATPPAGLLERTVGKCQRITVPAIEAHKRHLMRLDTDRTFVSQQIKRDRELGLADAVELLMRRATQIEQRGNLPSADEAEST
jgi:hypothetical protein